MNSRAARVTTKATPAMTTLGGICVRIAERTRCIGASGIAASETITEPAVQIATTHNPATAPACVLPRWSGLKRIVSAKRPTTVPSCCIALSNPDARPFWLTGTMSGITALYAAKAPLLLIWTTRYAAINAGTEPAPARRPRPKRLKIVPIAIHGRRRPNRVEVRSLR